MYIVVVRDKDFNDKFYITSNPIQTIISIKPSLIKSGIREHDLGSFITQKILNTIGIYYSKIPKGRKISFLFYIDWTHKYYFRFVESEINEEIEFYKINNNKFLTNGKLNCYNIEGIANNNFKMWANIFYVKALERGESNFCLNCA